MAEIARLTEANFQSAIIDLFHTFGWLVHAERPAQSNKGWRTPIQGNPGFPDIVALKGSRLIIAELKSQLAAPPIKAQISWLKAFQESGIEVYVWRPKDWDEIVEILKGE